MSLLDTSRGGHAQSSGGRASDRGLLLSDKFGFACDDARSPILYLLTNPERHLRLSAAARVLLACFSPTVPLTVSEAKAKVCRFYGVGGSDASVSKLQALVEAFVQCGVLVPTTAKVGTYPDEMIRYYAAARQVPSEICRMIASEGAIKHNTTVLDIGTGPGSIAIQLAGRSDKVTAIDISGSFLRMAEKIAQSQQRRIRFIRGDANKLVFHDAQYDVVTAAQVLHWLDPQLATRGICRILRDEGRLFVLESKALLAPRHPFQKHFGYGHTSKAAVLRECARHARQHAETFGHQWAIPSPLALTGKWLFRERHSFDLNFARAYFFEQSATGPSEPSPWCSLKSFLQQQPANVLEGDMYWLLLRFEKQVKKQNCSPRVRTGPRLIEICEATSPPLHPAKRKTS